jgi:hypothetical protein
MAGSSNPLPADVCPFRRPFPEGFDDCPAYQVREFVGFDLAYRPLEMVRTCRHLYAREMPGHQGRHYAACALGPASARVAWAKKVEPVRLEKMRDWSAAFSDFSRPFVGPLMAAKGRHLAGEPAATLELNRLSDHFLARLDTFLTETEPELEEIGLHRRDVADLVRLGIAEWVRAETADFRFQIPDALLKRFPVPVRALLDSPERRSA